MAEDTQRQLQHSQADLLWSLLFDMIMSRLAFSCLVLSFIILRSVIGFSCISTSTGLPTLVAPFLHLCWPLCSFVNHIYLLSYLVASEIWWWCEMAACLTSVASETSVASGSSVSMTSPPSYLSQRAAVTTWFCARMSVRTESRSLWSSLPASGQIGTFVWTFLHFIICSLETVGGHF